MMFMRRVSLICLAFLMGSCSFVPAAAPTVNQLARNQDPEWDVFIVKMTSRTLAALRAYQEPGFPPAFQGATYRPSVTLKPGDTIGVTVYESGGGSPLFGSTVPPVMTGIPGQAAPQATTLPIQIIENDGRIIVPYVGNVPVAGKTPAQAATLIQDGLSAQAVRPQVVVSLVNNVSNTVAVGGEVNRAGLMPLTLRGERLLDVVAWGGGPKYPAVQIDVRLMRGNSVVSVPLRQVMANPADNIVARPNDNITLVRNPKTFLVMGASQKVSQYPFEYEKMSVAEALALAGGGVDTISNLAGVFLFRYESGQFAERLLTSDEKAVDASFVKSRAAVLESNRPVPVIYRLDMTQADGYFFAQQTALRDKDIVVIANADSVQFLKLMQVVRALTGAYYDVTRSTNN
jgi:polysaccharide export outer membrane protein